MKVVLANHRLRTLVSVFGLGRHGESGNHQSWIGLDEGSAECDYRANLKSVKGYAFISKEGTLFLDSGGVAFGSEPKIYITDGNAI